MPNKSHVDLSLPADDRKLFFGANDDASVTFDADSLNIVANLVTSANALELTAGSYNFKVPADTDIVVNFTGTTNSGVLTWMEDEDYFLFSDDIAFSNAEFVIFDKASGNGLKVDTTTPTFGFADIIGDQFAKNTGATKPALVAYNGVINSWQFSASDEAFITFHIPHDYVKGTDIFLHIHWSHTSAIVTGGTLTFKATSIYAKGHNQEAFTGTPAAGTFTGTASTTQYQHIISETQYSASTPSGLQVDTDLLEPDGVIELTFEVDANDITSSGAVPDPFIHYVDIHYQTTGLIGTKDKAPDFYA